MKNTLRRILSCFLAVILCLTAVAMGFTVSAAEAFTYWNSSNWTVTPSPSSHLYVEGVTESDPNDHNMRKYGQTVIPDSNTIYGAKVYFNLTSGNAEIRIELRSAINGAVISSENFAFSSQGNGNYWYQFNFTTPVNVTAGNKYYLVYWLTKRDAGSVCVVSTSMGVTTSNPGYYWWYQNSTEFVEWTQAVVPFEILTTAPGVKSFTKWTSYTNDICHLALEGVTSDSQDGNWHNMNKLAQAFAPADNVVRGAKLLFNLTSGDAEMHLEVRSEVNGTALYSENIPFTSAGNKRNWYTFKFATPLNVTAGETYYLVWWLTKRTAGSVCVPCGSAGISTRPYPAYRWHLDGETSFVNYGGIINSFEILGDEVNEQFRSMDSTSDLANEYGTARAGSGLRTEGNGSVAYTLSDNASQTAGCLFIYVYAKDRVAINAAGATHLIFDLYCPSEGFINSLKTFTADGGVNVSSATSGAWDSSAAIIPKEAFKAGFSNLKVGWNQVVMALKEEITVSAVGKFRMYINGGTAFTPGETFMIDDIRFVNQAYLNGKGYADANAAKPVVSEISTLTASSTAQELSATKAKYDALTEDQKEYVSNYSTLVTLIGNLAGEPTVKVFRNLDNATRTAQEAATSTITTAQCVEGIGAARFEHAVARTGGLYWYVYCEADVASVGVDITGMDYILMDFYVSDIDAVGFEGNGGLYIRSTTSTNWVNDVSEVTNESMQAAFANIKEGWNHLVLPIKAPTDKTDAFAFRMHFSGGWANKGFYSIIDDIRFCNEKYLTTDAYSNSVTAKAVSGKIGDLDESSTKEEIAAVRAEYTALTEVQRGFVGNVDRLTKLENGQSLAPAPRTFSDVPSSHLANRSGTPGQFSIVALSDLHYAVNWSGQCQQTYYNSMNWIANNAQTENIKMAVQLGDATSSNTMEQWQIVNNGYKILGDANVPYSAVVGNHDYGNGRSTDAFNEYLPASHVMQNNPHFGGSMAEGKMENSYYTFEEAGAKYMVLNLTCYPKADALAWADGVVKAHPQHNVILFTHSYLQKKSDGTLGWTQEVEALAEGFNGQSIWDGLIYNNPNIFLVMSAHNSNSGNTMKWEKQNAAGKTVTQVLMVDPQDYENTYGGMGFAYLIRFNNGVVSMEYVTTRFDKDFGTASNFTFTPGLMLNTVDIEVNAVIEKIDAIGEVITLDSETKIAEARAAYDALEDAQKAKVDNYDLLTAAEEALAEIKSYGDVNGDGTITSEDALTILQASVEKIDLTEEQARRSDVDGDGKVTAVDALFVLQKAVDKIEKFPVQE